MNVAVTLPIDDWHTVLRILRDARARCEEDADDLHGVGYRIREAIAHEHSERAKQVNVLRDVYGISETPAAAPRLP